MMDSVIPIDISSDSDIEIQEPAAQSGNRVNPPWLTTGSDGYPRRGSSPERTHSDNGNSSNAYSNAKFRRTNPALSNGIEDSSCSSRLEDPKYVTGNGNFVNSRISNIAGADYEKLSSQQALKRTLPPSLNLSTFSSRPDNGNGRQLREAYSSPSVLTSGNRGGIGDRYGGAHDEIGMMRGINGARILPPSMKLGTSASSSHYDGSSDTVNRFGIGEHINSGTSGNDERLIYQAALQDLNQPKTEANLPEGLLSVPLLRHQKIALAWMIQKETRSLHCLGGILADDQGLGKTVSMIALIQLQKLQSKSKPESSSNHKAEALDLDADDESGNTKNEGLENVKEEEASTSTQAFNRKRPAAGTLVVCPASVLRQWARELDEKVADESKLSVVIYHGGNRTKDPVELAKYDVVLTTYSIVTNELPKQPMVDEDENDEKNTEKYGLSSGFSANRKRKNEAVAHQKSKKRGRKKADDSSFDYDCGALARVGWFRVILDEAQTIKNHRTQVARACCSLRAKRRWCLSGTPIQNSIDDLYSYFRFLKYDPYAVYKSFYHTIKVPISRNSLHGYKKLQAVLRAIMLRRTKETLIDGQPIIKLPPKMVNLTKVDFSAEEWSFYRQLEADSRSQFKAYAAAGTLNQNYANILLMLLRLRQACDHPQLVKGFNSNPVSKLSEERVRRIPWEACVNLLKHLESSSAICCVCTDPPEDPVVSLCGHVFCYQCVSEYITGDDNTCPVPKCREHLGHDVIFSESTLRSCISDDLDHGSSQDQCTDKSIVLKSECSSSKIRAVLDILQSLSKPRSPNSRQHGITPYSSKSHDDDVTNVEKMNAYSSPHIQGSIKTIIFSQWTGMLDLVQLSLNENGIEFRRLDGTMTLAARDRSVKEFSNDPDVSDVEIPGKKFLKFLCVIHFFKVKVMLMSLKAGNLGLNMVAACHVILLDLWWNPTTEDQAVDRTHRIGQTRPVTVTRITIKDTVEDRILALQEEKRKMVASAFGEDQGGSSATRLTVDDLKYLFMV